MSELASRMDEEWALPLVLNGARVLQWVTRAPLTINQILPTQTAINSPLVVSFLAETTLNR